MPVKSSKNVSSNQFNLTKATEVGRILIKFGGIAILVLMVGRLLINGMKAVWIATHPEPPPPPTQGFGALPALDFLSEGSEIVPKSYVLELPGQFPEFPDRATVYLQPKAQISLLSLEETKAIAARLGFMSMPTALDSDDYRWRKTGVINATLEMNTVSKNFSYETDYLSRPEVQLTGELPNSFDAVQTVKQFLDAADLLPDDMATPAGKTKFLKIVGGGLKEAVSLSDAQVIQVDLFRTDPDGLPTFTSDGTTGVVTATVASLNNAPTVISMSRVYAPLDYTIAHTYPLRSVQEAWQLLKSGEGYIAAATKEDAAVVRDVKLGYYETYDQEYLQPIYVFTGDNGFIGFVPALSISAQSAPDPLPMPSLSPSPTARGLGL